MGLTYLSPYEPPDNLRLKHPYQQIIGHSQNKGGVNRSGSIGLYMHSVQLEAHTGLGTDRPLIM